MDYAVFKPKDIRNVQIKINTHLKSDWFFSKYEKFKNSCKIKLM